jgi:ABC-2 type transport system permease protein
MIRAIRCELARLRSPFFLLGGVGLMTALGLVATMIIFVTAKEGSAPAPPGVKFATTAMLEAPDGMFAGLENAASMIGMVALAIWAIGVTSDYSSGMIRLLVQAEPSRIRLLGGQVVALTGLTCLATLVTTIAVAIVAPTIAGVAGVSTNAWSTDLLRTVAEGYVNLTLCALLWGVVGLFIGTITRSSGVSIGLGIGYLIAFEGLLGMALGSSSWWLPGSSFSAIASGGTADLAYSSALVLAAGYAVLALAVAAVVFRRRDITA